jgi:hypothetical protein
LHRGSSEAFQTNWPSYVDKIVEYCEKLGKPNHRDLVKTGSSATVSPDEKAFVAIQLLVSLTSECAPNRRTGKHKPKSTDLPVSECHKYIVQEFKVSFFSKEFFFLLVFLVIFFAGAFARSGGNDRRREQDYI